MTQKSYIQKVAKTSKENTNQSKNSKIEESVVTVTFTLPQSSRNAFKAKVSSQGKTIKDVLVKFIEEYVQN